MVSRGGPGDAARVQMRMKCESVDHGVDGCGAAWVQVGMVVVINDHVGSDGGDCGDADDDDDYDGVQWWPGDATWVQVRVMMVKYEFVGGDVGDNGCCGVGNGDQQSDHLIAIDQPFQ